MVKVREKKGIKESWTSHCKLSTEELAKENGVLESARVGTEKGTMVTKVAKMQERTRGKRAAARKAARAREGWQGKNLLDMWKSRTHCSVVSKKGSSNNLYAIDEEDSGHVEEANDSEEDLQAWCRLEESEIEQWQEVVSKKTNN